MPVLSDLIAENVAYKESIKKMAVEKAIEQGLDKTGRVTEEGDYYYGKLEEFAMHSCTFYECHKCKKPYYGGLQDCEDAMNQE